MHILKCKDCKKDIWKCKILPQPDLPVLPTYFEGHDGFPDPDPVFCRCPACGNNPFIVDNSGHYHMLTNEGQIIPEYKGLEDGRFMLAIGEE